jgi:arabinose-5-phosphate isomerase
MKSSIEIKKIAQSVIDIETKVLTSLGESLNDEFVKAVEIIAQSKGRLIVAGIGKSANISKKIVATFNSTGQPAVFLHASDAIHGDLGNIQNDDIVLCLSKSGNTLEIKELVSNVKKMGNIIISISSNSQSYLSENSNIRIDCPIFKEACPYDLAPTSSTTAQLVLGDALAICLLEFRGFTKDDFAKYHPGGILGKKLTLQVSNLISTSCMPSVNSSSKIKKIIMEISKHRMGATAVVDNHILVGIVTDGDLRRGIEDANDIRNLTATMIMNSTPALISKEALVYDAFLKMKELNITQLIVVEQNKYCGIIHLHDIIKEGIAE